MSEFGSAIAVTASPATCYALWNDLDALQFFAILDQRRAPTTRQRGALAVRCVEPRAPSNAQIHGARRGAHDGRGGAHWQSTDGFPCGVVAGFWPHEDAELDDVRVEAYCACPSTSRRNTAP